MVILYHSFQLFARFWPLSALSE